MKFKCYLLIFLLVLVPNFIVFAGPISYSFGQDAMPKPPKYLSPPKQPKEAKPEQPEQPEQPKQPKPPKEAESDSKKVIKYSYAVLCVKNETGIDIEYIAWWGEEDGGKFTIKKDEEIPHWYQYPDGESSSPDFFINFPPDKSNINKRKELKLKRYRSFDRDCNSGKSYIFRILDDDTIGLIEGY